MEEEGQATQEEDDPEYPVSITYCISYHKICNSGQWLSWWLSGLSVSRTLYVYHDLEVVHSNPSEVEFGVQSASV